MNWTKYYKLNKIVASYELKEIDMFVFKPDFNFG